jgi:uncharacterized RDD family membrane protein YckC
MICGNCGAENPAESEYCCSCGQALDGRLIVREPVCANHPNKVATSVCSVCGLELCEVCECFVHDAVYCEDCLKRPEEEPPKPAEPPASPKKAKGRPARLLERAVAAFLDGAVLLCGAVVMGVLFWTLTDNAAIPITPGIPLFKVYWFVLAVGTALYCIGSIASTGQTPGMSAADLVVVGYDGKVPGWRRSAVRFVGSFLSVVLVFGLFMPLWDKSRRMWHDKIAHTVMVKVG